jgi:bifunctional oligoribonuclease and PAP phosphatase NrnA
LTLAAKHATDVAHAAQALRDARRITAICHENPDADTIGAAVAVSLIAERLGTETEIVSADGFPPAFAFLAGADRVRRRPELAPDLAVICDAATLERVGRIATEEAEWFAGARILNVDHHVTSSYYGDLNLVDPTAAATCQVLVGLVDAVGITLDPDLATALLTGIVRDSQGFADRSTSGDTLRTAARLVEAGAPLADIHRIILSELPYPTMALWGKMLANMGSTADGRVVFTRLTLDMLAETGTQQHDADGLAEFLAHVKGADITLLLRELGPEETRVSIRTTEAVDATAVAAAFGGGGHARRAGCTVAAHLDQALPQVLDASVSQTGP